MGQKVNPIGIRLGITEDWRSTWYADTKKYADMLEANLAVREYLRKEYEPAQIGLIRIEQPARSAKVTIHSARPGIIIGKKGEGVEKLRQKVQGILNVPTHINIEEIRKPELDAKLVADSIAQQLNRRIMFRRAMKRAITSALSNGAKGIKISVSGRLGGAEIARTEWLREGRVPLHTLREIIDYATSEALTTYGIIGVKVWIFKGEKYAGTDTKQQPVNTEQKS
jgi:small subunit ribosomal protein S3